MSEKATLQAIYDQLCDQIIGLRDAIEPKVVVARGELVADEFGRKRPENDDELCFAKQQPSAVVDRSYETRKVCYWPALDSLCILRERIAKYIEQTP